LGGVGAGNPTTKKQHRKTERNNHLKKQKRKEKTDNERGNFLSLGRGQAKKISCSHRSKKGRKNIRSTGAEKRIPPLAEMGEIFFSEKIILLKSCQQSNTTARKNISSEKIRYKNKRQNRQEREFFCLGRGKQKKSPLKIPAESA